MFGSKSLKREMENAPHFLLEVSSTDRSKTFEAIAEVSIHTTFFSWI